MAHLLSHFQVDYNFSLSSFSFHLHGLWHGYAIKGKGLKEHGLLEVPGDLNKHHVIEEGTFDLGPLLLHEIAGT